MKRVKKGMIFLVALASLTGCGKKLDGNLLNNRKYLASLEEKDPAKIEKKIDGLIKKREDKKLENIMADENREAFELAKAPLIFENTVFMGDSMVEFIREAKMVKESSVLAEKGETVFMALDKLDQVYQLAPKNIVIFYGMNDSLAYSADDYEVYYDKLIKELKKNLPEAKILIQEPLDVLEEKAYNKDLKNTTLADFRKRAQKVAQDNQVDYIELMKIIDYKNLYEPDGVHMVYNFYPVWLEILAHKIK